MKRRASCLTCGRQFSYNTGNRAGLFCSRYCYVTHETFLKKQASKAAIALSQKPNSQNHPRMTDGELLNSWERVKNNKGLSLREEFGKYGYKRVPPKRLLKLIGSSEYTKCIEARNTNVARKRYCGKRNYQRGYEAELRARSNLSNDGYYVMRSSASLTAFDLIAINREVVRLIQIKRCKNQLPSYKKDIEEIRKIRVPSCCKKELWIWRDRRGWIKKTIQ